MVHLQSGHYLFNLVLGRPRRASLVITAHDVHGLHTTRRRPPRWPYRRGMRRADGVIIHSAALRSAVVAQGVDPRRVHVVPRAAPPLTEESADADESTILFFGHIWPYKGLEHLIAAEPAISRRVPAVRIVIAGQGEELTRYRRNMATPERFEIHNRFVSREDRTALFRRASVVVLPYVEATTSAVIPIAYLHRKPVVATSVGGLVDAVDDGQTGYLVPSADHGALADALVRLLLDRDLRRRFGDAGRRKLETEHAPEFVGRRALEVYERRSRATD